MDVARTLWLGRCKDKVTCVYLAGKLFCFHRSLSFQHTVGAVGQAWLSNTFNVLDILSYPVSIMGPTMVRPEETLFKIKFPRCLENAVF